MDQSLCVGAKIPRWDEEDIKTTNDGGGGVKSFLVTVLYYLTSCNDKSMVLVLLTIHHLPGPRMPSSLYRLTTVVACFHSVQRGWYILLLPSLAVTKLLITNHPTAVSSYLSASSDPSVTQNDYSPRRSFCLACLASEF